MGLQGPGVGWEASYSVNKRITPPPPPWESMRVLWGLHCGGKFGVAFSGVKVTPEGWRRWGSLAPHFVLLPAPLFQLMLDGHL